ncbi:MAG: Cas10/Cmr2 second palm domain-containing protein [Acidobacteriota bacterium]
MPRSLLAAEADQIQDLIFRSSRLRAVVGGSQLLSRFCRQAPDKLSKTARYKGHPIDVIVHDGGAFRIEFRAPTEEDAKSLARLFGGDLAELYRRCLGSSLTLAEPVSIAAKFQLASTEASTNLRKAKNNGDSAATVVHLPYVALCESCGMGVAADRYHRHENEKKSYYCEPCLWKEREREPRTPGKSEDQFDFLETFRSAVKTACESRVASRESREPNRRFGKIPGGVPEDADAVGAFDLSGRNYVAYLLADGNGMGKRFDGCPDKEALRQLSLALPEVLRASLAAPCPQLLDRIAQNEGPKSIIPVLPLILGGDDLMALLPASWALDYARRFCTEYEQRLKKKLEELKMLEGDTDTPTIAAAVVICKASYPHNLAHSHGERLLDGAKRLARHVEIENGSKTSVLSFGLVAGDQWDPLSQVDSDFRPTARPYLVGDDPALYKFALPVERLIRHRHKLAVNVDSRLPGKRRAEVEALFEEVFELNATQARDEWKPRLDLLLGRLSEDLRSLVKEAIADLGDASGGVAPWRRLNRSDRSWFGHGLPDLLTMWPFSYDLDRDLKDYGD